MFSTLAIHFPPLIHSHTRMNAQTQPRTVHNTSPLTHLPTLENLARIAQKKTTPAEMTTRQSRPPPSAELIFNHTFAVQGREGGRERCIKKRSVMMSNAVMHGRWIKSRPLDGRLETWMNRQWRVFAQSTGEEGWLISQALQNRRPLIHPTKCLCVTDSSCVDVWGHVFVFLCVCVVAHLSPFISSFHRQEKKNHAIVGDVSRTSFSRFEAFYSSSSSPQTSDFGVRVIFCIHRFTPALMPDTHTPGDRSLRRQFLHQK